MEQTPAEFLKQEVKALVTKEIYYLVNEKRF